MPAQMTFPIETPSGRSNGTRPRPAATPAPIVPAPEPVPDPTPRPSQQADAAPVSVPPSPVWERFVVTFGAMAVRLVAAAVSYEHMRALAEQAGEGWRSWLLPISVDGLAVVALVTIRRCRRLGLPPDRMAWLALVLALGASLAANVAAAAPTPEGRLVAAWPPAALLLAEVIHKQRDANRAGGA